MSSWTFNIPRAMKWGTQHQVILAKKNMGIQLKQDTIKTENKNIKGCKALQRGPRIQEAGEHPMAFPGWAMQVVERHSGNKEKSRMLLGACSFSTT